MWRLIAELFGKYLFCLAVATVVSALIMVQLYRYLLHDENYSHSLTSPLGYCFIYMFISYNFYLFVFRSAFKTKAIPYVVKGLFCLVWPVLCWLMVSLLSFGFDGWGTLLTLLSAGVVAFGLPYLDAFLRDKIHFTNNADPDQ
jgi:hypothetical protein